MIRLRRRNTAWLMVLAAIIFFALFAASVAPGVQFLLLALFAIAAVASTVEIGRERENLFDAIKRAPLRQRISPQAREALERARARGSFIDDELLMLDIGLIALQSNYEGMAFRRTRNISKDDDGVRPFVTLHIGPEEAERNAVIKFEIMNQYGEVQFVHEMRAYLREGEMSIMTDHHLPLAGNRSVAGTGDWDLRVYVDGGLVAMHNFMLAPSMNERQSRLSDADQYVGEYEDFEIIEEIEEEVPPRLHDLLQQEQAEGSGSVSATAGVSRSRQHSGGDEDGSSASGRSRPRSATRRRR